MTQMPPARTMAYPSTKQFTCQVILTCVFITSKLNNTCKIADGYVRILLMNCRRVTLLKKSLPINSIIIAITLFMAIFSTPGYSASFSGKVGFRADFFGDPDYKSFDGNLLLKTYFSGSLNIVRDLFLRAEVSFLTKDIVDESFFNEVPATFQIDELSLSWRAHSGTVTNFLSLYLGNYEPVGAGNFLTRYLGVAPVMSRLLDSTLGLNGGVISPNRAVGGCDIMRFTAAPVALGLYFDVNHALDSTYVLNGSLRLAGAWRYFLFDIKGAVGLPLTDADDSTKYASLDRIYFRAAATIFLGNDVSGGVYMHGGFCDVPLTKSDNDFKLDENKIFFLFEPRIRGKRVNANITLFYVPDLVKPEVNQTDCFLFKNQTTGVALDIFSNPVNLKGVEWVFGVVASASVPKYLSKYDEFGYSDLALKGKSLLVAPYFLVGLFRGELRAELDLDIGKFNDTDGAHSFSVMISYKTKL